MSDKYIFVAMEFKSEYTSVFEHLIEPACKKVGVYAWRVDKEPVIELTNEMHEKMRNCVGFIAEVTAFNLNVMYEIGFLVANNKKGILISQCISSIPFYLRNFPIKEYGPGPKELGTMVDFLSTLMTEKIVRNLNH